MDLYIIPAHHSNSKIRRRTTHAVIVSMAAARWEQGQRQGSRILTYSSVDVGDALTDLVFMPEDGMTTTTDSANTFVRMWERCASLRPNDEESLI